MEYLTIKEISKVYKVSDKTIRNWLKKGMPVTRIGNVLRFKIIDTEKWIKEAN